MTNFQGLVIGMIAAMNLTGCDSTSSPIPVTVNNVSANPVGLSNTNCSLTVSGGNAVTTCDNGLTFSAPAAAMAALSSSGTAGAQGPQGSQGAQGAQGSQGLQGVAGATGAQGIQGSQGVAGAQGSQGTAGTAAPTLIAKNTSNVTINATVTSKTTSHTSLWDSVNNAAADYDYTGNVLQETIYYNGASCTGTPYVAIPLQTNLAAVGMNFVSVGSVFSDNGNHLYQVMNLAPIQTTFSYMAMRNAYAGACNSYGTPQNLSGYNVMQVQAYSGILPSAITLPLTLQ